MIKELTYFIDDNQYDNIFILFHFYETWLRITRVEWIFQHTGFLIYVTKIWYLSNILYSCSPFSFLFKNWIFMFTTSRVISSSNSFLRVLGIRDMKGVIAIIWSAIIISIFNIPVSSLILDCSIFFFFKLYKYTYYIWITFHDLGILENIGLFSFAAMQNLETCGFQYFS